MSLLLGSRHGYQYPAAATYTPPLIGVSTTNTRGQTAAQSIAATESACGPQGIRRDYADDNYVTFNVSQHMVDVDTTNKVSKRVTHLSWNPDLVKLQSENPPNAAAQFSGFAPAALQAYLAAGRPASTALLDAAYGASGSTETRKNIDWLLSIPSYHKVLLNPCHEADNYQSTRTYGTNYGQFRNGFRVICDIIHAFKNPNWLTCLLLTAYAFKPSGTANDPSNFWPAWSGFPLSGNQYVDVMGVDVYNEASLTGTRWDSPQACMGLPANSDEATTYGIRYDPSNNSPVTSANGWRIVDQNGFTWNSGFLGWCEAIGVTKIAVGEIGTIRNIMGVTPAWCADLGITSSKNDWIKQFGRFAVAYSQDPRHRAKFYALEYFMSSGRTYTTSGVNAASTAVHSTSDGTLYACSAIVTSTTLPSSGYAANALVYASDTKNVYKNTGTAASPTWTSQGAAIPESWQLWWNDDGSGWDSTSSGAAGSAYVAWAYVTSYAAASGTANNPTTDNALTDSTYLTS